MILAQLELIGFKSFAKRTKIRFHPGITGIVGPNGCGKSNIVDAIRWVMGEQKGSALRSERMEQVIFNGTQTRKPLGMAEINLTVENNLGVLPSEYTEVEVARRLYRSSESEYLLNKQKCRLKDIVDLFLDTGLGAGAYGLIEMSLIQRILDGNPEERRLLFEEAAGIAKYKLRVKTANRRLEGVNDNLERLSDILSEVEKNVRSLKRQYNQAKSYEGLKKRQEEIETSLLALERAGLLEKFTRTQNRINEIRIKLNSVEAERSSVERQREKVVEELNRREDSILEIRGEWEKYQSESIKAENQLLLIDERERNAVSERERAAEAIEIADQRIKYADERIEIHRSNLASKEDEFKSLAEEVEAAKKAFNEADSEYEQVRSALENGRREVEAIRADNSVREKNRALSAAKIESGGKRTLRLKEEQSAIKVREQKIRARKTELEAKKLKVEEGLNHLNKDVSRLEEEIISFKDTIEAQGKDKSQSQLELERRKSELKFLHSLIESGEDRPQGVNYLLAKKPKGILESLDGALGVGREYALAIEAALGDIANAVLVENKTSSIEALKHLSEAGAGRATLIPLDAEFSKSRMKIENTAGIVDTADKLVECKPQYRDLVNHLLGKVLVVEDWEAGLNLRESGAWEGLIVTLNGEIWGDITITGGKSEAKIPLVGRVKQAERLESKLENLKREIDAKEDEISALKTDLRGLEEKKKRLSDEKQILSDEAAKISRDLAAIEAETGELNKRLRNIEVDLGIIAEEKESAESELAALLNEATANEEKLKGAEAKLERSGESGRKFSEAAVLKKDEFHNKQLTLNTCQGEIERLKAEIVLGESRKEELSEEIIRFRKNIESQNQRLEQLAEARTAALEAAERHRKLRDEWREKLSELEGTQAKIKSERSAVENKLRVVSIEVEKHKSELSSLEVQAAEVRSLIASKEDSALDKYGVDLEDVDPIDAAEIEDSKAELGKIKSKLAAIGAVNLLALEEYGMQKERLDFLQSEYEDIVRSKAELMETITRTNAEARIRFKQVMSRVAENFHLLFVDLFEGGEGRLLLGAGDPLEAEIILQANPAGKKLGSLEQMSGGEKTLTALALLFSLYQVKPSPFCVLDEVDAPLDDANVERFLKLIRRFTPKTQFVLVTHNKITMEACDYLYGVTMQEEGVSKLVSVEMRTGEMEVV